MIRNFFRKFFSKEYIVKEKISKILADEFVDSVTFRPDDLVVTEHYVQDLKTGKHWWIANGKRHFGLWRPQDFKLTDNHKKICWKSYLDLLLFKVEQEENNTLSHKSLQKL